MNSRIFDRTFKAGKAIGLLGVRAPFRGLLYDLPSGSRYGGATSRPVFLLLVGSREKILEFYGHLKKELLGADLENRNFFLLFTNQVVRNRINDKDVDPGTFKLGKGIQTKRLINGLPSVLQYTVSRNSNPASGTFDLKKIQTPYTLPLEAYKVQQVLWIKRKKKIDCAKQWLTLNNARPIANVKREGSKLSVKLFADPLAMRKLPTRRQYIVSLKVLATDFVLGEEHAELFEKWSFDERSERELTKSGAEFFPALNLLRFVEHLVQSSKTYFTADTILNLNSVFYLER